MVLLIILLVLLFLLFYPVMLKTEMVYEREDWQGKAVFYPFFCVPWIKIVLWDSNKPKKEKPPKKENKKKKSHKDENGQKTITKEKGKGILRAFKEQPLSETIAMALDLLKTANRGIHRLRVRLGFGYALEDPALMGYITGAVYSAVPAFLGDMRKTRWRIGVYPQWQTFQTMAFVKGRITVCLFDLIYALGGVLIKTIRIVLEKIRRK